MGEVLATVKGRHRIARGASHTPQSGCRPWRAITNATFDEAPCGLDGIEVVRIRWQPLDGSPALLNEELDLRSLVRREIVEHHDVAATQTGRQSALHPRDEAHLI